MRHLRPILAAFALLVLAACSPRPTAQESTVARAPKPPVQTGEASYYSPDLAGKPTASGEPHRPQALTAASRTLPLGTVAKVTNLETGDSVAVEVNDRGPYAENRILDVSRRAAEALDMTDDGVAPVAVEPVAAPED